MTTLLVSLIGISLLCTCYGIIKIIVFMRESTQKRSAFDHRAQGRRSARSSDDRRSRTEIYPQA